MSPTDLVPRVLFALIFLSAGVLHFVRPRFFLRMMPDYLPWHLELVYASGVAEVALGAALLVPGWERPVGWALIALLIAVFPANVNMALHPEKWKDLSPIGLYLRLPFQAVLIAWAWAFTQLPG